MITAPATIAGNNKNLLHVIIALTPSRQSMAPFCQAPRMRHERSYAFMLTKALQL
jgi:hypothetical protein